MGVFNNFPYTNWHELNLDWFIAEFERLQSEWDSFGYTVTASAHPGLVPNVTVTGDLTNGLNFDFTLVRGDQGDEGPEGPAGNGIASVSINGSYQITFTFTDGTVFTTPSLKGDTGSGLEILDTYATLADLQTAHPSGNAGDMYLVGVSPSFVLYLWSTSQNAWVEGGALSSPSPSITTPLMDGEASTGIEFAYSRGDHVHPTDTSRASASDLTALQTTVSNKADSSTVTSLANRVSTAEGNITSLQTGKQDLLINESNIKSINGTSLLGMGTLSIEAIAETGSSAQGDWIKFTNGIMVCWYRASSTSAAINTAYGNLYIGSKELTFPQEFSDIPTVLPGEYHWGTSGSWCNISGITTTKVTLRGYDNVSRATGTATYLSYLAIGPYDMS